MGVQDIALKGIYSVPWCRQVGSPGLVAKRAPHEVVRNNATHMYRFLDV